MDYCVCIRAGARLRLFLRTPGNAAVRGLAPSHFASVIQPGRGTGSVARARDHDPVAGLPVQIRRERKNGDYHSLRARGTHRLALDAGTLGTLASIPLPAPGTHGGIAPDRDRLADGGACYRGL